MVFEYQVTKPEWKRTGISVLLVDEWKQDKVVRKMKRMFMNLYNIDMMSHEYTLTMSVIPMHLFIDKIYESKVGDIHHC